jgi:hypothetical protein
MILQIHHSEVESETKNAYAILGSNRILDTSHQDRTRELHNEGSSSVDPYAIWVQLWVDVFVDNRCAMT